MRRNNKRKSAGSFTLAIMALLIFIAAITLYKALGNKLPNPLAIDTGTPAEAQTVETQPAEGQAPQPSDEVFADDAAATGAEANELQAGDGNAAPSKSKLFGVGMQDILAMEIPAVKGVHPEEYPDDPYWAMEDENTDADSQQAAAIIESEQQQQQQEGDTPIPFKLPEVSGEGPRVLVYCTHSNEAFKQVPEDPYTQSSEWRTLDPSHSILSVAGLVSQTLNDQHGIPVLFDSTDHEEGKYYKISYDRSLESIRRNQQDNPTLQVFLDIHRDATSAESGKNDVVMVDGKPCAKVMIVIGTGEGKTGEGFAERPNWQENKKFADAITAELNKMAPGLARDVRVKTGRYNQHVSDHSLAIEVGHNMNTLQESMNTAPYLAQAIANVINAE